MTWRPLSPAGRQGPERLSAGLGAVARRMGSPPPAVLSLVFSRWSELVGPAMAGRCRPVALRGGTLVVAVAEPAWATEVRFLGPAILGRAAELAGEPVAGRIEVRVRPPR